MRTTLAGYFKSLSETNTSLSKMLGRTIEQLFTSIAVTQPSVQFTVIHDTDADGGCAAGMMLATLQRVKHAALRYQTAVHNGVPVDSIPFELNLSTTHTDEDASFNWEVTAVPLSSGKAFTEQAVSSFESVAVESSAFPYYRCVIVLDQAFNINIFKEFYEQTDLVIWIDHHIFSLDEKAGAFEIDLSSALLYIDSHGSATKKVHACLSGFEDVYIRHIARNLNRVAELVDHHDTWQFNKGNPGLDKRAKSFNSWFRAVPHRYEALRNLATIYNSDTEGGSFTGDVLLEEWIEEGKLIALARDLIASSVIESKCCLYTWTMNDIDYQVAAVIHSDDMDNLGEKLLKEPDVDIAAIFYLSKKTKGVRVSLRSRGSVDVNVIAKRFGGGGHLNAAGFEIPVSMLSVLLGTVNL